MATLDTTSDPAPEQPRSGEASAAVPVVEIAFHSNLDRIGQRFVLRERGGTAIGRGEPIFVGRQAGAPLLDPCVSRRQLSIEWAAEKGSFVVHPEPGGRRTLRRFDSGAAMGPAERVLPGAWVAVGDRVLLHLSLAASAENVDEALVGNSSEMARVRERIGAFARGDATLLVVGETGSGKELVARALHEASERRGGPFVTLNCAALPDSLLESELFGHASGAYTGAARSRQGLFRAAHGGTLLLDEVGELSPSAQAKLLRVLHDRRVRMLGQEQDVLVDCRVIAATHRSLADEVRAGRFREDLYMRLAGLTVQVPPLRDRLSDVPLLFVHFLRRAFEGLGAAAPGWLFRDADLYAPPVPLSFFESLLRHPWPGNVRELERLAMASAALSAARGAFEAPAPGAEGAEGKVEERERGRGRPSREELVAVLEAHGQVQRRAAQALGVPYATLDRWLREHGIARARDLDANEVRAALEAAGGDVARAAAALGVSPRGLRRRVSELERSASKD